jgi:hypothetical protein
VKVVAKDIQFGHFLVGDYDPGEIAVFIQFATNGQDRRRGCGADEFDDGAAVGEQSSAPVSRDEREEAVFDLAPFLVPGGRWRTAMVKPNSSVNFWRSGAAERQRALHSCQKPESIKVGYTDAHLQILKMKIFAVLSAPPMGNLR